MKTKSITTKGTCATQRLGKPAHLSSPMHAWREPCASKLCCPHVGQLSCECVCVCGGTVYT